jgi:hypothetical protein
MKDKLRTKRLLLPTQSLHIDWSRCRLRTNSCLAGCLLVPDKPGALFSLLRYISFYCVFSVICVEEYVTSQ